MDFGRLFSRSWAIVWGNKWMIGIGFLAALGASGLSNSSGGNNFNYTLDENSFDPAMVENMAAMIAAASAAIFALMCVGLLLAIVFWVVRTTAQAGLIEGAARVDMGEKLGFSAAMRLGWGHIGRMLGLSMVLFGAIFLLGMVIALLVMVTVGASIAAAVASSEMSNAGDLGALAGGLGGGVILLLCCLICGTAILSAVVSLVFPFAQRAIVLEDHGVFASLGRAWNVIRENVANVILLVIAFVVFGFLIALVVGIVLIPVGLLAGGPTIYTLMSGQSLGALDLLTAGFGILFIMLVSAAVNAIWVAFRSTATTLAYQEFTSKKALE